VTDRPLLERIDDYPLRIPFRVEFRHASASRAQTAAVLVRVRTANDVIGWGEGCPREYVTGETVAGAREFITRHREAVIREIDNLASLRAWVESHSGEIDANPAAWCALELALLDALARTGDRPLEALLGLPRVEAGFTYTAVIGSCGAEQFGTTLQMYRELGLDDFKIKLSGEMERDRANIERLRAKAISPDRVRADANNLWEGSEQAAAYLEQLDYPFYALEEPLGAGQMEELAALGSMLSVRIILDESLLRVQQIPELAADPGRWIVNLRVSKMGGLLRSLNLAEQCRVYGIPVIVGAQVGETSVLTRAAVTVINAAGDIVVGAEGAFGTYLLESDPFEPSLMFGKGGRLDPNRLPADQPGLGMSLRDAMGGYIDES
jgi:L-alanine-DL-glutamate epimerase-like enolase superfamily enzyme